MPIGNGKRGVFIEDIIFLLWRASPGFCALVGIYHMPDCLSAPGMRPFLQSKVTLCSVM